MRNFILWDGNGEVQGVATPFIEKLPPLAAGQKWVEITDDIATHTADAKGNTVARIPPLVVAQATAWTAAKTYREGVRNGGCMTPKGRVQTDTASQRLIDQKGLSASRWATANSFNALNAVKVNIGTWTVDWVMSDNTVMTHTATDFVALHEAVIGHNTACQAAGAAIRAKIFAAMTVAAVQAVDITSGYPTG